MHIIILILRQPTAEDDVPIPLRQLLIACVQTGVPLVIYRIVWLHSLFPFRGILPGDNRPRNIIHLLPEHLEMLVLDHPGIRHLTVRIVHDSVALVIGTIMRLLLETDGPVLQFAETITVILIDLPRENDPFRQGFPIRTIREEIRLRPGLHPFQQSLDQLVVPTDGHPLVFIIKIVVVEDETDRQALDDEGGKLHAWPSPLLFRIALDQTLVDIPSDKRQGLLLQVPGLATVQQTHNLVSLLLDPRLGLRRGPHAPHLIERVHVKRQVIKLPPVTRHGGIGIAVKLHDRVHEIPYRLVRGMEDMRPVLMDVDAFLALTIQVPTQVGTFVYHQATFPLPPGVIGESRPEQARADH